MVIIIEIDNDPCWEIHNFKHVKGVALGYIGIHFIRGKLNDILKASNWKQWETKIINKENQKKLEQMMLRLQDYMNRKNLAVELKGGTFRNIELEFVDYDKAYERRSDHHIKLRAYDLVYNYGIEWDEEKVWISCSNLCIPLNDLRTIEEIRQD